MSDLPLVSILIPCYNAERWVGEAIQSALDQTYPNTEIIVVDDGSTDRSLDVIKSFGPRIRWETGPNGGPAVARNRGLAIASGVYVGFLDADDTWHREKLALQVATLEEMGEVVGVCFSDCRAVGAEELTASFYKRCDFGPVGGTTRYRDPIGLAMLSRQPIILSTMVVRRRLLEDVKAFDEGLRVAQDTDLIFRLSLRTEFCSVNRVLASYSVAETRVFSQSALVRRDPMVPLRAQERMYRKLLAALDGRYPGYRREIRRRLEAVFAQQGKHFLRVGQSRDARRAYRKAVGLHASLRNLAKCGLAHALPGVLRRR